MAYPVSDSYSAASGGVIAGGRHHSQPTAALMGDSLTDDGYGLTNFYLLNALNGGVIKLLANSGVASDTVQMMLSRVDNLYTNVSPGFAGLPNDLGWAFVRAGTNNARGGNSIASISAAYTSLLNKLAGYASRVVILAVPPLAPYASVVDDYNAWLSTFAASNSAKFTFVDDCISMRDGSNNQIADYFNADGVHFNRLGVASAGRIAGDALSSLLAKYSSPLSDDPADKYPSTPQWFPNPTMIATGTAVGGSFPGFVADNVSIGGYGAGMAGTCSIVAADIGDTNQTSWQRIELTQGTVGSSLDVSAALSGRVITATDPEGLESVMEVRTTGIDRSKIAQLSTMAQAGTGEYFAQFVPVDLLAAGSDSEIYVLRGNRKRSSNTTPGGVNWHFYAATRSSFGPSVSAGYIDIRCITLRG